METGSVSTAVEINTEPDRHQHLLAARELFPVLDAEARRGEELGQLSPTTVKALGDAQVFWLLTPRFAHGLGASALEALEVFEELSAADGSTGWVSMAAGLATGSAAAFLPSGSVTSMFGTETAPIVAGQAALNGRAVRASGGYVLSGKWNYGSGLKHADYSFAAGLVADDGGKPEPRVFIVPRSEVTLDNNWDVIGLRGTGSVDFRIDNVFVPEEMTFLPQCAVPPAGAELFRLGIVGVAAIGHTAFAIGIGRRALSEIESLAVGRSGALGRLCDSESFQSGFALNQARFQGARALVYQTWSDIQSKLDRDETFGIRDFTRIRLALNYMTTVASEITFFAYSSAGGVGLRAGPIQRYFRDMCAGAQHLLVSPPVLRDCGRELLGVAAGLEWRPPGLVKV